MWLLSIGIIEDGGQMGPPNFGKEFFWTNAMKNSGIFGQILRKIRPFSAKYQVKFGNFVIFGAKIM